MGRKITARLIIAIFSTLLWEAALVAIVLWGLPKLGIEIPLVGLIGLIVALGAYSVITYRIGSRALRRKPIIGLPNMIGTKGRVVSSLAPEGTVKIGDELWEATSTTNSIEAGEKITVVAQDRLKLVVRKSSMADLGD